MAENAEGAPAAPSFTKRLRGHHEALSRHLGAFERALPASRQVADFHTALEAYVAFHDSDIQSAFVSSGAASQTVATAFVHALRVMLVSARLFGRTWSQADPRKNPEQFRKELGWAKTDLEKQRTVIEHRLRSVQGAYAQRPGARRVPSPSFLAEAE